MGVIAAALGMGLASGDKAALADAAFYAANHALVKAALFLTVGVVATLSGRGRSLALIVAAFLGLSLAGLPLTGGALAKLALKGPFGDGAAGMAAQFSAAASTALMLCFVMRLARFPRDERRRPRPSASWSWLALAARVVAGPVAHVPARRQSRRGVRAREALGRGLADADRRRAGRGLWAAGDRLPRIPAGDILVAEEAAFRASFRLADAFERADRGLRQWPAAGAALLVVALALAAAGYASR